jgi:hypothetical protein
MASRSAGIALFVLLALALPATVSAHFGGAASIIVPLDHINPGESFPVIASDLGASAGVIFQLQRTDRTLDLGRVTAGPDGHFQSTFDLPADFPLGYVVLVGASDDGSLASTWILVGPRSDSTPAAPNAAPLLLDPAVWLVGGVLAGLGSLLVVRLAGRQRSRATVCRPGERKRRRR